MMKPILRADSQSPRSVRSTASTETMQSSSTASSGSQRNNTATRMTHERTPFRRRPLSTAARAQALEYVKYYESNADSALRIRKDFDAALLHLVRMRKLEAEKLCEECFDQQFHEYVLLEIQTKNRMKLCSSRLQLRKWLHCRQSLRLIRDECIELNAASPRWHGKIYRELVNDALAKVHLVYDIPEHTLLR